MRGFTGKTADVLCKVADGCSYCGWPSCIFAELISADLGASAGLTDKACLDGTAVWNCSYPFYYGLELLLKSFPLKNDDRSLNSLFSR